jgi:hypothetical protein
VQAVQTSPESVQIAGADVVHMAEGNTDAPLRQA